MTRLFARPEPIPVTADSAGVPQGLYWGRPVAQRRPDRQPVAHTVELVDQRGVRIPGVRQAGD